MIFTDLTKNPEIAKLFSKEERTMAKKSNSYWLGKLDKFLSLQLLRETSELSRGLEVLRRRDPLTAGDAEKAKNLLGLLNGFMESLNDIKASLIAGLPPDKWADVGAGTVHEETVGC